MSACRSLKPSTRSGRSARISSIFAVMNALIFGFCTLALALLPVAGARRWSTRSSPSAPGDRHRTTGPEVVLRDGRLFWLYLGHDFLEIRTIDPAVTLKRAG